MAIITHLLAAMIGEIIGVAVMCVFVAGKGGVDDDPDG